MSQCLSFLKEFPSQFGLSELLCIPLLCIPLLLLGVNSKEPCGISPGFCWSNQLSSPQGLSLIGFGSLCFTLFTSCQTYLFFINSDIAQTFCSFAFCNILIDLTLRFIQLLLILIILGDCGEIKKRAQYTTILNRDPIVGLVQWERMGIKSLC